MYADRYDTVAADLTPFQIRQEHFSFSAPYALTKVMALVPKKIEAPSLVDSAVYESSLLMRMFDKNVWITLIVALVILFGIIYLSKNYSVLTNSRLLPIIYAFLELFKTSLAYHGRSTRARSAQNVLKST
jgi:hypothetical protein